MRRLHFRVGPANRDLVQAALADITAAKINNVNTYDRLKLRQIVPSR